MALGENYNPQAINSIREESRCEKPLFDDITKAIAISGTTVTPAGLILAGTFSTDELSDFNPLVLQSQ